MDHCQEFTWGQAARDVILAGTEVRKAPSLTGVEAAVTLITVMALSRGAGERQWSVTFIETVTMIT